MCKPGVLLKVSMTNPVKKDKTTTCQGLVVTGNDRIKMM
jgi:hypothetical protein